MHEVISNISIQLVIDQVIASSFTKCKYALSHDINLYLSINEHGDILHLNIT